MRERRSIQHVPKEFWGVFLFVFVFIEPTKMTDPVNPQDKVVVVAVMAEKEDTLIYIVAHVACALLC